MRHDASQLGRVRAWSHASPMRGIVVLLSRCLVAIARRARATPTISGASQRRDLCGRHWRTSTAKACGKDPRGTPSTLYCQARANSGCRGPVQPRLDVRQRSRDAATTTGWPRSLRSRRGAGLTSTRRRCVATRRRRAAPAAGLRDRAGKCRSLRRPRSSIDLAAGPSAFVAADAGTKEIAEVVEKLAPEYAIDTRARPGHHCASNPTSPRTR